MITVCFYFIYFNWRIKGSPHDANFVVMIVFAALNGLYSLTWDLLFDWNLLKPHSKYFGLRNTLVYKDYVWAYYLAIVVDVILRFSWFLYIFNGPQFSVPLRGFMVGMLEAIRRFTWNFFRLESEHQGNADAFRVCVCPKTFPGSRATNILNKFLLA